MSPLHKSKTTRFIPTLLMLWLAACAAPATPVTPTVTSTSSTATPTSIPSSTPTPTAKPTPTQIPGYEGWSVINPRAVEIAVVDESLVLTLKSRVLWFMGQRGVLFHQDVSGNFKITADVYTSKASDSTRPPGGDGSVQLSGLMARDGSGGLENYVFVVVGDDGNGLSVETKNTVDGISAYNGPSWNSAAAELRLCRFEATLHLYKRAVASQDAWILADTFDRPDLPDTLQVGVNIYTDSNPDLQARIENLQIDPITVEADCES